MNENLNVVERFEKITQLQQLRHTKTQDHYVRMQSLQCMHNCMNVFIVHRMLLFSTAI